MNVLQDNIRIRDRHLFLGEKYRDKCVSKRQYFLGVKVHVLMTFCYHPIEWILTPGRESDVRALYRFNFPLTEGSVVYSDAAYTDYEEEELLESQGISLFSQRRSNSKRPRRPEWLDFLIAMSRKNLRLVLAC